MENDIESQDFEKELGKNPLVTSDFKITVITRTDYESFVIRDGITVPKEVMLERDRITKLYALPKNRKVVSGLGVTAQALFLWVAYELEYGKDWILINRGSYMKENGLTSVNSYKRAVADLVKENILALSLKRDVFWINPVYFFCGSRVGKYPDNVVEYKPKVNDK